MVVLEKTEALVVLLLLTGHLFVPTAARPRRATRPTSNHTNALTRWPASPMEPAALERCGR